MHRVLVLGAGMVAKPLIDYLLNNNCNIKIACNTCSNAQKILRDHPNGEIIYWDADDSESLKELVKNSELVISLLPYRFHASVAEVCIEFGKDMVTTSYVRDKMSALDEKAKESGIIILNEIGLDPGIDHMSAMRIIDNVKSRGGQIKKFWSICGALPAPGYIDNPLGYKFTWSPEGVLLAGLNDASYMNNGEIVNIKPEDLFKKTFLYEIDDIGTLEVYANRDSISYIDIYGLEGIQTMYRGTFRFRGWCETIDAMKTLNLLSRDKEEFKGMSYADLIKSRLDISDRPVRQVLAEYTGAESNSAAMRSFEWLGLLDEVPIPGSLKSSFEVVSDLMTRKMVLGETEKDMIVLKHVFHALYEDGSSEVISSQMVDYGSPSTDTSIARTVALPAAVASKLILDGQISLKGVFRPVKREIYVPVLERLEEMGIKTEEKYGLEESELIF